MVRYLVETFVPYSWKIFQTYEEACDYYMERSDVHFCRVASMHELRSHYDSILLWTWSILRGHKYHVEEEID